MGGGAPGRAGRAGSPSRTIPERFVDLTRPVRTLFDFEEIEIWPYGKNARSGYREFVAIYARPHRAKTLTTESDKNSSTLSVIGVVGGRY